ncbi:MAG: TonB-dependent receptor [Saprospiraceae bacterium]|nr:TonB-dependent receptor [Saprospiraceae bacterium]
MTNRIDYYIYILFSLGMFCFCQSYAQMDSLDLDSIDMTLNWEGDIVVTGAYAPTDARGHMHPIRVIDKATIERRAAIDLNDLLQQELGIKIVQDAVLGSNLSLQGLSGEYIKIMIDGVPVIGRSNGNIDLSRISMGNVERIEVVDGPLSAIYGNNALGGTINIITKKKQEQVIEGDVYAQWESMGLYNGGINLGTTWKRWHLNGTYTFNKFDGFSVDTLRSQEWNPKQQHHANANLGYTFKNNFSINYNFRTLQEKIMDLGPVKLEDYPELAYAKDYNFLTKTYDHNLSYKGNLGEKYYLDGVAAYNFYKREKNAYFNKLLENPEEDELDSLDSDTTFFRTWMMRTSFASQYKGKVNFLAGVDLNYEQGYGERISADSTQTLATIADYAVYAGINYQPISKFKLELNGRISYNSRYLAPVTYGIQFKWTPHRYWTMRWGYTRGFRAPSLKELYLDFVDSNHFIKGNPNLKAERSHNVRLGVNYRQKIKEDHHMDLNINLYYNYLENQISLFDFVTDSTGTYTPSTEPTYEYTYFNQDYAQNFGKNTVLSYQYKNLTLKLGFNINGQYNILHASDSTLRPILLSYQLTQEITYNLAKYGLSFSLFRNDFSQRNRYTVIYNPITQEEEITDYEVKGYSLMDVMVTKSLFDGKFRISMGVKNILGVTNVESGANGGVHSSGGAIPTARGRFFFTRLKYNF